MDIFKLSMICNNIYPNELTFKYKKINLKIYNLLKKKILILTIFTRRYIKIFNKSIKVGTFFIL